jgi:TolB-like protein
MKTIIPCRTILVATLVAICGGLSSILAQDLRPAANALAEKITASGRKKVAVVDFTDLQGNVTQLGRFIAEELSIALAEDAKQFAVIDRTSIRVILQEHKLASQGLIDPETARKLGQIAGVDVLVSGTLTPLGDSVHVGLKALDAESAQVIVGLTVEIPRTSAVNNLLGSAPDPSTSDPQAVQGLSDFRLGDFELTLSCRKNVGTGDGGQDLSDQVLCSGAITNKASQTEDFAISNKTYLVDNTGHQAPINWESVGDDEKHPCCTTHSLEPGLPLKFWFDSRGYSDGVTAVTVIFLANGHKTILHNISLQGH